jgi:predicted acylesterase/phospholipase RssA/CRP-like cAMP-binding protein
MHPCSNGLSGDALNEIVSHLELVRLGPGDCLHRANEKVTSIYLVIHGRLKLSMVDIFGNVIHERFQVSGGQFGGMAVALSEPAPVNVVAVDPTTLLGLNYRTGLELTRKHERLRSNFSRLIAESTKNMIIRDRRIPRSFIVTMFYAAPETRQLTRRVVRRLQELGENPCVFTDNENWVPMNGVDARVCVDGIFQLSNEEIQHQINDWSDSKRIIFDVGMDYDPGRIGDLVDISDQVFWCVTADSWEESVPKIQAVNQRAETSKDKNYAVWLLDGDQMTAPVAPRLCELVRRDFKLSFHGPADSRKSRLLIDGFERFIHQLRGIQIGVALGGGAARGMAHLGVLKALADNGIPIDMIAGTSAGAMTGILYAAGLDPDYLVDSFVKELTPNWFFRMLPGGDQWYLLYKYRSDQFDPMLRKYLHDLLLEQLSMPISAITVDLISARALIRESGDAVQAITESINLPVLSQPINRDGMALIDGGLVNNIPADVLVSKGCNFVIAVSVTSKIKHEFARNHPDTPTHQMKPASILQTVLRSTLVQNVSVNAIGIKPADFVIELDVSEFETTDFALTDQMAAIGEKTTRDVIPQIKELLSQLDKESFPFN